MEPVTLEMVVANWSHPVRIKGFPGVVWTMVDIQVQDQAVDAWSLTGQPQYVRKVFLQVSTSQVAQALAQMPPGGMCEIKGGLSETTRLYIMVTLEAIQPYSYDA